ncbi:MAG: Eco57I restriction-modification methylase domain-containing protein [Candidatus Thorarchaeota archaeon]
MNIEDVSSSDDLHSFLNERGFVRTDHRADLYKIDSIDHFLRVEHVSLLDTLTIHEKRKEFVNEIGIQYHLLVQEDFSCFVFQRYGPSPTQLRYDRNRRYREDTLRSIQKKINSIQFSDTSFNPSLFDLFEVKELVKKFYTEFREVRSKLSGSIKEEYKGNKILLAQVILDRIIFLYFLSSRGLLDDGYLSKAYSEYTGEDFYQDFLCPLFFSVLNEKYPSEELTEKYGFHMYLNGGLFTPREGIEVLEGIDVTASIRVGKTTWKDVFSLLDSYEWVVEEENEDSSTLTPSILGHIYEKTVIEDSQKETGSFYTPQWVTEYIADRVLGAMIDQRLSQEFGETDWCRWLDSLRMGNVSDMEKTRFLLHEVLMPLKACDNACGSGAFLMALFSYLVPLYMACIHVLTTDRRELARIRAAGIVGNTKYDVKKHIVTNNLYGVDIQPGAIEIAKLRLWLALVSDMDPDQRELEPLPNIAYNIVEGDSLLGYVRIPEVLHLPLDKNRDDVVALVDERQALVTKFRETTSSDESILLQSSIEELSDELRPLFDDMYHRLLVERSVEMGKKEKQSIAQFHWFIEFPEVFGSGVEGGFDVIIGNPPYFRLSKKPRFYYDILDEMFMHVYRESNGYAVFTERSHDLLRDGGHMSYIVHKNLYNLDSYSTLRESFAQSDTIVQLTDFGRDVFIGVTAETVMHVIRKEGIRKAHKIKLSARPAHLQEVSDFGEIRQSQFVKGISHWNHRYVIRMDKRISARLDKIRKGSVPLRELCDISRGIETGNNKRFVSLEKKGKTWKPLLRGRDIGPYWAQSHAYVDFRPSELAGARDPNLIEWEKLVTQQNSIVPTIVYDPGEFYVLNSATYIMPWEDKDVDLKALCIILNSPLMQWFFQTVITNYSTITINILPNNLGLLPIKLPEKTKPWHALFQYMTTLAALRTRHDLADELFSFYDTNVVKNLVDELYTEKTREVEGILADYITPFGKMRSAKRRLEMMKEVKEAISPLLLT